MGSEKIAGVLGDFVTLVSRKNKDLETTKLIGVTVEKETIESFSTGKNINLRACLIIEKDQFVVRLMDIEKAGKLAIALYKENAKALVSSRYRVFKVTNPLLNSYYLSLLFKKQVTDKELIYRSFGGIRGELGWKDFIKLPIAIPELELQETIVNKYQTITKYIEVKKRINELLERKMKAYFHILFDDLKDYETKSFEELFTIIRGGVPPRSNRAQREKYFCKKGGVPWLQVKDVTKQQNKFVNHTSEQLTSEGFKRGKCKIVPSGSVVVGSGVNAKALGHCMISFCDLVLNTTLWGFRGNVLVGGASQFLLLISIFWLKRMLIHWSEWSTAQQIECHLT